MADTQPQPETPHGHRRKRRSRRLPCPHCGAMMPTREHRCTCCGQDIARTQKPIMWAVFMLFAFLLFSATIFVASLWLKR